MRDAVTLARRCTPHCVKWLHHGRQWNGAVAAVAVRRPKGRMPGGGAADSQRSSSAKAVITLDVNELPPHANPVTVPSALLTPFLRVFSRRRKRSVARRQAKVAEALLVEATKRDIGAIASTTNGDTPLLLGGLEVAPTESDAWILAECPTVQQLPGIYWQLAKGRLTVLVVATCAAGFCMAPVSCVFVPSALLAAAAGTTLMSTAANTLNQVMEVPYDSQMRRTQARPLVLVRVSPLHAVLLATGCVAAGSAILCSASASAAALGVTNVLLYAGVYTPMKRHSVACTWVGAAVGAIPPLMGWAAAGGDLLSPAAFTLAGVLFSWQFPHFNALSWNVRPDYSKAGYRVMCVTDPALCRRTTLRHSVALLGFCSLAAPLSDLTTWQFGLDSLPLNAYLIYLSARFYKQPDAKTSRSLFRYTLIYLPLLMMLMIVDRRARRSAKPTVSDVSDPIAEV